MNVFLLTMTSQTDLLKIQSIRLVILKIFSALSRIFFGLFFSFSFSSKLKLFGTKLNFFVSKLKLFGTKLIFFGTKLFFWQEIETFRH